MNNAQIVNPNDHKVVSFHNSTDFGFTPDMGCMYDGRPINGKGGSAGIDAGETIILPYHIGKLLAKNLAKRVLNTSQAATIDPTGVPTGVPIWSEDQLETRANSYITDLYSEEKPIAQSQTELLLAKVEEYKAMVDKLIPKLEVPEQPEGVLLPSDEVVYQDKQEVIAELEKRGIKHDKRSNKSELEKLLA